jgi:hypothetical protein
MDGELNWDFCVTSASWKLSSTQHAAVRLYWRNNTYNHATYVASKRSADPLFCQFSRTCVRVIIQIVVLVENESLT